MLLLPLIGWCVTGAIFLIKPGYGDAYTQLEARFYPLGEHLVPQPLENWQQMRLARTNLGLHLFALNQNGWHQYDPQTLLPRSEPATAELLTLLADAIRVNPARYGKAVTFENGAYVTATGVVLSLDWNTLSLQQRGSDRALIDGLYNVHYLRWTGVRALDNVLGVLALLTLVCTSLLGARLLFKPSRHSADAASQL